MTKTSIITIAVSLLIAVLLPFFILSFSRPNGRLYFLPRVTLMALPRGVGRLRAAAS